MNSNGVQDLKVHRRHTLINTKLLNPKKDKQNDTNNIDWEDQEPKQHKLQHNTYMR
jgi:hypothetical protein